MKLFYPLINLFLITLLGLLVVTACYIPPNSSDLRSGNNNDERDDEEEEEDDNNRRRTNRICGDRDSCQDSCDDMFGSSSARNSCYDLEFGDINDLTTVADALDVKTKGDTREMDLIDITSRTVNDLEDEITEDNFSLYLSIGLDDWVEAIEKTTNSADVADVAGVAPFILLQWIGENSEIAQTILDYDKNSDLGRALFNNAGKVEDFEFTHLLEVLDEGSLLEVHLLHLNFEFEFEFFPKVQAVETADSDHYRTTTLVNRPGISDTDDRINFLIGFLRKQVRSDSFMSFSDRNPEAFSWGHQTLVNFCEDLMDENSDQVEVKQCIQAVYCAHRVLDIEGDIIPKNRIRGEGIFRDLKKHESIVGEADEENCEYQDFIDEDRMEDQFE